MKMVQVKNLLYQPLMMAQMGTKDSLHLTARGSADIPADRVSKEMQKYEVKKFIRLRYFDAPDASVPPPPAPRIQTPAPVSAATEPAFTAPETAPEEQFEEPEAVEPSTAGTTKTGTRPGPGRGGKGGRK